MNWKMFWIGMCCFLLVGIVVAGLTVSTDTLFGKTDSTINEEKSLILSNYYSDVPVDCATFECERITITDYDKNNKPTLRTDRDYLSITNQTIKNTEDIIAIKKALCEIKPELDLCKV